MGTQQKDSTTTAPVTTWQPRRRRVIKIVVIALLILLLLSGGALFGVSYYFSSQILQVIHYTPTYDTRVLSVSAQEVRLQRVGDVMHPGEFEIEWPAGQAIVGPMVSSDATSATRQLLQTTSMLAAGTLVYWTRNVYTGQLMNNLGLRINEVNVPDALGNMPAWYVPGKLNTWAILVHGRGTDRNETLRYFPTLAKLGFPLLAISYRNDIGAPASPDGFNHLGDTEWQDVEAAVKYALTQGAQHVVIFGWSQGGAVVESFIHRSSLAHDVLALVLDSPILNWRATLVHQTEQRGLPDFLTSPAEAVATIRAGINFDALDQSNQAQPAIPMLLFQGAADSTTPPSVADAFAAAHPDLVTYIRVAGTEHTEEWNTNPQVYASELTAFLTQRLGL